VKLQFCAPQAAQAGLHYMWIDTCCIDKSSSAELSEAINSMFSWYRNADICYVYLSDVAGKPDTERTTVLGQDGSLQKSRWFTRGWILQELLAPTNVEFFTVDGTYFGPRDCLALEITEITGIPPKALQSGYRRCF
jgi:hypothetical protein